MILEFCGAKKVYSDNLTVEGWLEEEGILNREVALVQVNGVDVPLDKRDVTLLHENDVLNILYFLGDS